MVKSSHRWWPLWLHHKSIDPLLCTWNFSTLGLYDFPFGKGRGTKWLQTCFPTPFQGLGLYWAIKLKSEWVACKNNHILSLRVRCIYNLHTCTFKEQSTDSPPNHKAPKACIYFTMQSYGCYVAKTKIQFIFELWIWAMLGFINNHQFLAIWKIQNQRTIDFR